MPYPRRVRQPGSPAGAGRQLERHSTASQKHIVTGNFPRPKSLTTVATEIMIHPRISCVVKKPVCTPVPPAGYGSAAGDAGYAPPAFTWSDKATCRLAASGTKLSGSSSRKKKHAAKMALGPRKTSSIMSELYFGFWGAVPPQPPPRGERSRFPRASASPWVRVPSQPMLPPGADARTAGSIDSLASGIGVNSHSPTRVIVLPRA